MNTNAFISHRMFVAALSHGANEAAKIPRAERVIDLEPSGSAAGRAWRNQPDTRPVARRLLAAAISGKFGSARP